MPDDLGAEGRNDQYFKRRRSIEAILSVARVAITGVLRLLVLFLRTLSGQAESIVRRQLDGGYRPEQSERAATSRQGVSVEVTNLCVAYRDRLALQDLTGQFAAGSLTAVVGPNGAGKSTLLKALAGILPAQTGVVRSAARSEARFAYLPQQSEIDRDFPVAIGELVALGGWRSFGAFRRPPDTLPVRVADAMATAGLEGFGARQIADLSAGEFQRALFARLLVQDAAVVLLDEPFTAVDERTTDDLLQLVRRWHQEGRTVIAVLHDLDQVREHFPSTLLLARSCIGWGDTASVLTSDNLMRAREILQGRAEKPGCG
jgi:zinc/manganese transport system ATP-binding protein